MTAASSQLRALEAQPWGVVRTGGGGQLPILRTNAVRFAGHFLCLGRSANAQVLPLRERSGLLRARGRDNKPSRSASNSAASEENEGNCKASGVHAARVARSIAGVKGRADGR